MCIYIYIYMVFHAAKTEHIFKHQHNSLPIPKTKAFHSRYMTPGPLPRPPMPLTS